MKECFSCGNLYISLTCKHKNLGDSVVLIWWVTGGCIFLLVAISVSKVQGILHQKKVLPQTLPIELPLVGSK